MRTFVTTVGAAAFIGFAGLFQAATAGAAPLPAPLSSGTGTSVHGQFTQDRFDSNNSDRISGCLERQRVNRFVGPPLPVAGRWDCSIG
jgi:hypothetical protein